MANLEEALHRALRMADSANPLGTATEAGLSVPDEVRRAIDGLKSEWAGDFGIDEAVVCGQRAIPALRRLLFAREPSGLYHARRRAVEALAVLHANDVLMDFLRVPREASDSIELVGDEAVINAAALALMKIHEEHIFQLLLSVAQRRPLMGVTAALGSFQRQESIPYFVEALAADDCRLTAEATLRRFGRWAEPALLETAVCKLPSAERESVSSIRRRKSALALLADIPIAPEKWPVLRQLLTDKEGKIILLACNICMAVAPIADRKYAVRRLIESLSDADWMLAEDIEGSLVSHFDQAADTIAEAIQTRASGHEHGLPATDRVMNILLEVQTVRAQRSLQGAKPGITRTQKMR